MNGRDTNMDGGRGGGVMDAASHFKHLLIPSLVYGAVFGMCLYDGADGVAGLLLALATMAYLWHAGRPFSRRLTVREFFYPASFILLGVGSLLTDSQPLVAMNCGGMLLLLLAMVVHAYSDDGGWDVLTHFKAMALTLLGTIGCLPSPVTDGRAAQAAAEHHRDHGVLIGLAIGLPLAIIILKLLSSADLVFASLVGGILDAMMLPEGIIGRLLLTVVGFFGGYAGLTCARRGPAVSDGQPRRKGNPKVVLTITAMLAVIYVPFCLIQFLYLVGHMTLPAGVTYAQYAHQGFFQLLAVAVINTSMVIVTTHFFDLGKLLKVMLMVICGCTFVMIASSAMRMVLYVGAYGLTFLRLFVLWQLVVIAMWMIGIAISICRPSFALFRYGMVIVTALYIILALIRPDYWIARYNIAQGNIDGSYLSELSADAAAAIADSTQLEAYRKAKQGGEASWSFEYIDRLNERLSNQEGSPLRFNVSRYQARRWLNCFLS